MKVTIAVHRNVKWGHETVFLKHPGDNDDPMAGDYVRLTEWIEVDAPDLTRETVVASEISSLDKSRALIVTEFSEKLASIDRRKAELLALPSVQS